MPSPPALTYADLRRVLEPHFVDRGASYAAMGRVLSVDWDPDSTSLYGRVSGGRARPYTTTADWTPGRDGTLAFVGGDCSCPMVGDCTHVAALVIAGCDVTELPTAAAQEDVEEDWRGTLDRWTRPTDTDDATVPLGIHLIPGVADDGTPTLTARLVQEGRQGWTNGNLRWHSISTWAASGYRYGVQDVRAFPADQVRLAKALHALASTASGYAGFYGDQARDLPLADFPHPQLWGLLRAAVDAGMPLRTGRRGERPVALAEAGDAAVRVDITADGDAGHRVAPQLLLDGIPRAPVLFIGRPAHGVLLRADDEGTLLLAPLDRPVPAELAEAIVAGQRLRLPTDAEALADAQLRLRQVVRVASSDGSVRPPDVTGPTLVLQLTPDRPDRLLLDWGWRYAVGGHARATPVRAPVAAAPWRDAAAEHAVLDRLDPLLGGRRFAAQSRPDIVVGLADRHGLLRPSALLEGEAAIAFGTDVLPALQADPDVDVVVLGGELPAYRDVTDEVEIRIGTHEVPEQRDWFGLDVTLRVDGVDVPLGTVFTALADGRTRTVLRSGAHLRLDTPEIAQLRELIEEAEAVQERPAGPLQVSRYQVDLWEQLSTLGVVDAQADGWRRQVDLLRSTRGVEPVDPPTGLQATLRGYQQEGYAWLAFLADHGLGGILADDMGLGKTVQALAMVLRARQADADAPPFLVLAPASVVHGWAGEAARFTPELDVRVVDATFAKLGVTAAEVAAGADVVITSYTRFRLDAEAYRAVEWSGLLLDEAQALKNHRSKLYGCVRRLGAPFTVAITGTPVENDLMELWSLLSVAAPGLFPNPSRFKAHFLTPIQRSGDASRLATLRRRIRPVVLRRTKEQVAADLPPKVEQVLEVDLTPAHRRAYDRLLAKERAKVLGLVKELDRHRLTVLRSLTLLRMASLHAGLVDEAHHEMAAAKLDVLVDHLQEVAAGGHRALVFSQFTSFLAKVRDRLDEAGIAHAYLDGSTRNRQAVVEDFREGDAPVFVISLKAGGVGLNLAEADYCFLLDPWWNPATEAQAVDRAHRIGQTRPVMVYRLIASGTIEEKVLELSRRKADLVDRVMDDGRPFDGRLTPEDVEALFS